jgi:hypothetical protein
VYIVFITGGENGYKGKLRFGGVSPLMFIGWFGQGWEGGSKANSLARLMRIRLILT